MADPPWMLIQLVRAATVDLQPPWFVYRSQAIHVGFLCGPYRQGWGDAPTPPCKSTQCTYGGSHREGWLATPCAAQYMDEDFEEWTGTAAPLHLRLATSLLFYTGNCLLASSYLPTLMYGRLPTQGWCPMMSFPRPCHRSTGAPCR
jgi:hypothetical protein